MEAKEKVVSAFKKAGKPLRPGEIAELAGLDKKVVEIEIQKLKEEGAIFSPKRCFYDLSK